MNLDRAMQHLPTLLLSLMIWLAPVTTFAAAKMYKWTDDDGRVHYSDRVPPEAKDEARSRLNPQGIEVEREEAAKTPEELAVQRELERLRKEQERILEEQLERDERLLAIYPTEKDLLLAREKKLEAVDSHIKLSEGYVKQLKERLADMQRNAGNVERRGGTVNQRLLEDINATQRQIEAQYARIVAREEEKLDIRERFDRDLNRLRQLREMRPDEIALEDPVEGRSVFLETLVACQDPRLCEQYWLRARRFAKEHASTPLQVSGDRIYMTAAPQADQDLSLTVSRIPGEDGADNIFLDIQCRDTTLGREFCAGPTVVEVRDDFRPAVMGP